MIFAATSASFGVRRVCELNIPISCHSRILYKVSIKGVVLVDVAVPPKQLLRTAPASPTHFHGDFGMGEKVCNGVGETLRIFVFDDQPGFAVYNGLRQPAHARADDGTFHLRGL